MDIKIRETELKDFRRLEEILLQNDMLSCPEVDGKERMDEIRARMSRYFLVAEVDGYIVGMIRGCYDGSRALIHQMAVDKSYQKQGIGKKMLHEIALRFKSAGAPSVSVTSTEQSKSYYNQLNFSDLPITLMVAFNIDEVIENTNGAC